MESSADLARKYGLERYLEDPVRLNETIFQLLLLQETIQMERSGRLKVNASTLSVRRSALGKFTARCRGDRAYAYAVETALKAATNILPVFHLDRFIQVLKHMGIPEHKIADYCGTIVISDDTHCLDED